ncbi:hypothetical protein WJX73_008808 [Symbiochloris irregularis]|uniref:Vesicle transport protein n=1 Tax=Symbiochloris irregularis TaxID=706552 RepID=A0AAW1P317_9CHLO
MPQLWKESVLAEWNKYSSDAAGPSQTDKMLNSMEEGSSSVNSFFSNNFARFAAGAQGLGAQVQGGIAGVQMPTTSTYVYFAAILGAGLIFLLLAFTLFLPVIMLAPAKFAICFTIGSGLVMASFVTLKGWKGQLQHMMTKERLPFSLAYIGSMGGTLYAAMQLHSYILSIVFCVLQFIALLYYVLSYFPGGTAGMRFVMMMMYQGLLQCTNGLRKTVM